jgi:hypothetical protein
LPRPRKTRRTKQKVQPEPPPKPWRRAATWIVTHFAAGYVVAAVALGVLFLVTATLGTVTNNDVTAAGMLQAPDGKERIFYYRDRPRTQLLPAFFQISKANEARVVCGVVPEAEVVDASSIRISNRFGKAMQSVLNALEWAVGLFYEIHFPTTLQATAKEVRDPNFGQQMLDLQRFDLLKMQRRALLNPECDAVVDALLNSGARVCPATWFLRSPDRHELLAVGISPFCVILNPGAKSHPVGSEASGPLPKAKDIGTEPPGPLFQAEDTTPLFTKIKIQLGILHVEVDHKGRQ